MKSKIITDRAYIVNLVYNFQSIGKVIVFVHGTFDILHPGHIGFLETAAKFGDILIVGVYNDEVVAEIKGSHNPVTTLHDRMTVLNALTMVDYVIPLERPDQEQIVAQLKPNIFVQKQGSVYQLDTSELEKHKGTIRTIAIAEKYSTSSLMQKIKIASQPR